MKKNIAEKCKKTQNFLNVSEQKNKGRITEQKIGDKVYEQAKEQTENGNKSFHNIFSVESDLTEN